MKNDSHLIQLEVPLLEGQAYTALCGKEIPKARYVLGWDRLEVGVKRRLIESLPFGCCRKCSQKLGDLEALHTEEQMRRHFIYAIRSAKKDDEESEAA